MYRALWDTWNTNELGYRLGTGLVSVGGKSRCCLLTIVSSCGITYSHSYYIYIQHIHYLPEGSIWELGVSCC